MIIILTNLVNQEQTIFEVMRTGENTKLCSYQYGITLNKQYTNIFVLEKWNVYTGYK